MQQTYMRRHVMVKAIQFTGKNFFDVQTFISGRKPEIKGNYAGQKWDEYCQKCTEQGYIEVPSSLGYDPIFQRCTPNDWIIEPEPGVYNVMAPETFDSQFRELPTADEIKDVSGVNALAEGYGPLNLSDETLRPDPRAIDRQALIDRLKEGSKTDYPMGRNFPWPEFALDNARNIIARYIAGEVSMTLEQAQALATHLHYKGGLYYRLFDLLHTETQEPMVAYLHLWPHTPSAYGRPKVMFEGKNDDGQARFEKIR